MGRSFFIPTRPVGPLMTKEVYADREWKIFNLLSFRWNFRLETKRKTNFSFAFRSLFRTFAED